MKTYTKKDIDKLRILVLKECNTLGEIIRIRRGFDKFFKPSLSKKLGDKLYKPRVWSKKGRCPFCDVSTGSKHSKECSWNY